MPNHEEETLLLTKFQDCQNNVLASSNSPVCPNTDIKLEASGGTSYSWTGPNGFTSTDQNPIIPNATSANSGTYSCTISGTGDCDGTYTVEVKVEDKTPPIPDISNLQDITGDCHTIVSTIPTATDNCSGKLLLLLMMLYNIQFLAPTPSHGNMMTETEIFLLKLKK
jgi:hypothetical protein